MPKVFTITLNPTIDETIIASDIVINATNIIKSRINKLGGKGLNVSRALNSLNTATYCYTIIGDDVKSTFTDQFENKKFIKSDAIFHQHPTRKNTIIVGNDGNYTKFNESGENYGIELLDQLLEKIVSKSKADDIWIIAGSLPKAIQPKELLRFINAGEEIGVKLIFDLNANDLNFVIQQCKPFLVKLNRFEAVNLMGYLYTKEILEDDVPTLINQCEKLVKNGKIHQILLTLDVDGVAFFGERGIITASVNSEINKKTTIDATGSGDAALAGYIYSILSNFNALQAVTFSCAAGYTTACIKGVDFGNYETIFKNQVYLKH
jgi:1-phosphofructokinase